MTAAAHSGSADCTRAEIEPDLTEWDYGDYEGQRSADIRMQRPDWNLFRDGCPRGEAPAQISDRADRLIARLRVLDGKVALFSHGHFGRVLAARWIVGRKGVFEFSEVIDAILKNSEE